MEEIDLKQLLKMFWNKKGVIILITIICMLAGFIAKIYFVKPEYTASTTLILFVANNGSNNTDTAITTDITLNSKLAPTYGELIKSKNFIRTVIANLSININEEELIRNIDVSAVKETELIKITVTNRDPILASEIANEIANVFMDKIKDFYKIENVQVVDKAELESEPEPSNINYKKDLEIFAGMGLIIAIGYVFVKCMFDTTIKSIEDVETVTKLPILSAIPICFEEDETRNGKGGKRK